MQKLKFRYILPLLAAIIWLMNGQYCAAQLDNNWAALNEGFLSFRERNPQIIEFNYNISSPLYSITSKLSGLEDVLYQELPAQDFEVIKIYDSFSNIPILSFEQFRELSKNKERFTFNGILPIGQDSYACFYRQGFWTPSVISDCYDWGNFRYSTFSLQNGEFKYIDSAISIFPDKSYSNVEEYQSIGILKNLTNFKYKIILAHNDSVKIFSFDKSGFNLITSYPFSLFNSPHPHSIKSKLFISNESQFIISSCFQTIDTLNSGYPFRESNQFGFKKLGTILTITQFDKDFTNITHKKDLFFPNIYDKGPVSVLLQGAFTRKSKYFYFEQFYSDINNKVSPVVHLGNIYFKVINISI